MTTYDVLEALVNDTRELQQAACREFLWCSVSRLEGAVRTDLAVLGEVPYLASVNIYVNDPFYRQGATACRMDR